MANTRTPQLTGVHWLAQGPLAPHVDTFARYLTERGYATNTFANCVSAIAHFAQWLHGCRLRVARIDEAVVVEFLDDHLPSMPLHWTGSARSTRSERCLEPFAWWVTRSGCCGPTQVMPASARRSKRGHRATDNCASRTHRPSNSAR
jgi:hypothetical protein